MTQTDKEATTRNFLGAMKVTQSSPTLCNPMDCSLAHQAPLSMEFSRQEYWKSKPYPSPGDLPNPGIKPRSPASQVESLPSESPGKPCFGANGRTLAGLTSAIKWMAQRFIGQHLILLVNTWFYWPTLVRWPSYHKGTQNFSSYEPIMEENYQCSKQCHGPLY